MSNYGHIGNIPFNLNFKMQRYAAANFNCKVQRDGTEIELKLRNLLKKETAAI